jgi:uncharacterized membrane protein
MNTSSNKHSTESKRELGEALLERHKRIREERRILLTTFIGLSGGAIVLSSTLLEKIAPKRVSIWLVILAWCFLAMSLLGGLLILITMTARSISHQGYLKQ